MELFGVAAFALAAFGLVVGRRLAARRRAAAAVVERDPENPDAWRELLVPFEYRDRLRRHPEMAARAKELRHYAHLLEERSRPTSPGRSTSRV